jgi:hypothetical protein
MERLQVHQQDGPMTEIELSEIVGAPAARALVDRFGGTDLNVPKNTETPMALAIAETIGADAAQKLIHWAKGCRFYLQRNAERERQIRAADLREMLDQGMTVAQVSQKFSYRARLTERQIYQILRGA